MAHAPDANALEFHGAAGAASAQAAGAVRAASRAAHATPSRKKSIQPPLIDFTSLGLAGWKQHGAMTIFRGKDGTVRFTDGRAVARRGTGESGGVEVQVQTSTSGSSLYLQASELLAMSDGVLPGVLTIGRRKGAAAPTLFWRGAQTQLVPLDDTPLAEAVGLQAPGGEPKREGLNVALRALGLHWAPLNGDAADADASPDD
eukprot:4087868-Pleurochrysis_carterae.AAC.1